MKRSILLENGRIIDPENGMDSTDFNLLLHNGRVSMIKKSAEYPDDVLSIDVSGKWIVPGLIDMHVHLREPGQEYKEDIKSGTMAAASGGFTGVACMPNTDPPNDNASVTGFILQRAGQAGRCRVYPVASITRGLKSSRLTEFGDLINAGAIAFSDDGMPVKSAGMMRLAMEYSLNFDALIISHAEDLSLASDGCMNEGRVSTLLGLKGIPWTAEDVAVFRDVALAELTGARLHIAHVSTKGAVDIIRQAKKRGVKVTAETAPHYFSLTEEAVKNYNTAAKMNPPLRTEEDRLGIIDGIKDGTIDVIATDHAPHSPVEKEVEFPLAANGITGLETSLPLAIELVRQGVLTPMEMVRLMSLNPARILGLNDRGGLKNAVKPDVTVIDPDIEWKVSENTIFSKALNTPFYGKTLKGRAVLTILDGNIVFDFGKDVKSDEDFQ